MDSAAEEPQTSHDMDTRREGAAAAAAEVLYEIRHHAEGAISPDPPWDQVSGRAKRGLLSYLSLQGINHLKEKWDGYRRPRKSGKRKSLFVSPHGEHVAVAVGNQITILQKDDNYVEPFGISVGSDRSTVFTHGTWSETQTILGVTDYTSTLYFIKPNGEEITRKSRSQLKLCTPIIGLIALGGFNLKKSCLSGFCIFTSDGMVHHIEVTENSTTCIYPVQISCNQLTQESQFPCNVSCLDFHPRLSLVVLVGASSVSVKTGYSTGFYVLYLLRITTSLELELMFCSPQFEGSFASPKGHIGALTSPKVVISPQGKHIATLDLTGCVNIYELDDKQYTLSFLSFAGEQCQRMSKELVCESKKYLNDIVDISWWTDHILILAKRGDSVTMFDILSGTKVSENDPIFSMSVIERVRHRQGYVFVLGATLSGEKMSMVEHKENLVMRHIEHPYDESYNQLDTARLCWRLMSFSQRSVSEMYSILVSNKDYQAALDFSNRYGLDTDEVFKAQWLHSDQGTHEIDMFLSNIKDQKFILSECVDKVGSTENAVKALVSYGLHITEKYIFSDSDDSECSSNWEFRMVRLQLLQYRDRLETFVGINMGRFSSQEYGKFRVMPLKEAAVTLAESGKIGALNLLFKRHPYSLSSNVLEILSAIPETVPVQSYGQLLPGGSPPSTIALRDGDWVECQKMVTFIKKLQRSEKVRQVSTENVLKHSMGFVWPSVNELSAWYKNRARDIDNLSGQLDNCLSLVEFACRKGILELQHFLEDISYLHQLVYSNICDEDLNLSLVTWEQLSDYEKFKMMLKGVKEDKVIENLCAEAIPFMKIRFCAEPLDSEEQVKEGEYHVYSEQRESFLVRWLKEIAAENKLDICLAVIEYACGDSPIDGLFRNETEIVETTLQCIYLCTLTDRWNMMASVLSRLPRKMLRDKSFAMGKDFSPRHSLETPKFSYRYSPFSKSERQTSPVSLHEVESIPENISKRTEQLDGDVIDDKLEKKIKIAEGHVEAGRLLEYYQVPKPMGFFLAAQSDEKNVKQLLRLILSKFARRQPVRSDNDWANMWRDMQCLQEKAFPFLDIEYMLTEFCRGLLKAGKFSLARNYLKGMGTIALATEKAEGLVIQAAREYFFSASSLACAEIWKAKECLSLFPSSKNVQAEADIIDALTIRLPNLGVTLLPMQFRQIRNPMEIINMVISSQTGAYLNVEELIEIAKLLGLSSPEDVTAVEEAVAREAAIAGDLQLAFDLCLVLARKGHGPVWDLCAAIARGPHLDNMDASSRKHLLGFALSHCDDESIGELLHAWKDVDLHSQYDHLITLTGSSPPNFSVQGSSIIPLSVHSAQDMFDIDESSEYVHGLSSSRSDDQVHLEKNEDILSEVGKNISTDGGRGWESLLRDNRKLLLFSAFELPWLLELSKKEEYGKNAIPGAAASKNNYLSIKTQALVTILYWLAGNDIVPSDDMIASLANSVMEPPITEEDDIRGCSFLLNLIDAFHGVEIIEKQLRRREVYQEIYSIMNIGMKYSSLNNSCVECSTPDQRRKLLLHKFQEKHSSLSSDDVDQIDKVQSTFWREWKTKLEEQKRLADEARALEQIIPGLDTTRFLSRDAEYIKNVVFSFIDSAKLEKRHILREAVKLADTYGLLRTEVLLRFFGCTLVSEHWENDDILAEISEFREDVAACPRGVIDMISSVVYPEIKGHNKLRLSYIYSILSACYLRLMRTEEPSLIRHQSQRQLHILRVDQYYKILEKECQKVSFIEELNFKNIAGLDDLNFEHFNEEICNNICESTVEALADMVRTLTGIYNGSQAKVLMSWQGVYKHHILSLMASLNSEVESRSSNITPDEMQNLISKIELKYDSCKNYFRSLTKEDISHIIGRYFVLCMFCKSPEVVLDEPSWKKYLIALLNFMIKLADDIQEIEANDESQEEPNFNNLSGCLKAFRRLVMQGEVLASQGWRTITEYVRLGPVVGLTTDISRFYKAMIFSGCEFKSIADVSAEAELHLSTAGSDGQLKHLLDLYTSLMDKFLFDLSKGPDGRKNLHCLLSSLRRWEGNHIEDLRIIREEIWGKLSTFSDDMQLESHLRVYALELMQTITGRNLRSLSVELSQEVAQWEAWDKSCCTKDSVGEGRVDVANSVTSTLVALRSTQLVKAISPNIKITSEDLVTLDSAVSCFLQISEDATSMSHFNVLQAILDEWEELFVSKLSEEKSNELLEEFNNWSSDEWEGWENLQEEPVKREGKQHTPVSVHPLHVCWMDIIKRIVAFSELHVVVELLDRSLFKPTGRLLDENEAQSLFQLVVAIDCIMTLKMVLLLPYEGPQVQCLHMVEAKLKKEGINTVFDANEYELVILVLSSGIIHDIITNPAFGNVFSYLCYVVGYLSRLFQEDLLKSRKDGSRIDRHKSLLFGRVLFPGFVSELVRAGQYLLAGFMVSQFMHMPTSLHIINVVEASLRRFLEGQILQAQPSIAGELELESCGSLVSSVSSLRGKLGNLLQSALSALPMVTVK